MSRKGQSITLSVSERDKAELEAIPTERFAIALEFGMMWGEDPNISKLIKAIAQHELISNNHDIEELQHNWCFRLDRINEAAITEIAGKWRTDKSALALSQLDQIDVEMHLLNNLAFAYQTKPEDKRVEWIPEKSKVKRVIREISNTFWFIREIMQYSSDCIVVSPEDVRSRIKGKLINLCQNYDLTASLTS
ncbi:MAG: WYL domain-containing protein [Dolichospermum sp. DEX182a]|nr:WYL domain-containing protein [Dolichospermum sp. DEX182a]